MALKVVYFQGVETQALSTRGQADVNLHCRPSAFSFSAKLWHPRGREKNTRNRPREPPQRPGKAKRNTQTLGDRSNCGGWEARGGRTRTCAVRAGQEAAAARRQVEGEVRDDLLPARVRVREILDAHGIGLLVRIHNLSVEGWRRTHCVCLILVVVSLRARRRRRDWLQGWRAHFPLYRRGERRCAFFPSFRIPVAHGA